MADILAEVMRIANEEGLPAFRVRPEVTYVVAPVVNELEVPLLAFPTPEQAERFLSDLGLARAVSPDGTRVYYSHLTDGTPLSGALDGGDDRARFLRNALFAPIPESESGNGYYYSGCGDVHVLVLRTCPIGAPVVPFSLD